MFSVQYKWGTLGIKNSHGCRKIEFCPVWYFLVTGMLFSSSQKMELTWSPRRNPARYGLASGSRCATKTPPPLSTPPVTWKCSSSSRLVRDRTTQRRRDLRERAAHNWRSCDVMSRDSNMDSSRSANSHSDGSPPTSKSYGDDVIQRMAICVAWKTTV